MLSVTLAVLVWRGLLDKKVATELHKKLGMKSIENMTFEDIVEEIEQTANLIEKSELK